MEKVKWVAEDSNYGGWTSKTSKKGKGPGKSKGQSDNRDDGYGEDLLGRTEDGSWGKDSVVLRRKIWEELGESGSKASGEAEAGASGWQESLNEEDRRVKRDESRMEDDEVEIELGEGIRESMGFEVIR